MTFEVGDRVIAKSSRRQGVVKGIDGRHQTILVKIDEGRTGWFEYGHFEKAEIHEHVHWAPKCHGDDHVAPRIDGGCDACGMKGEKVTTDTRLQYGDTVEYEGKEYTITCVDSVTGLLDLGYLGPNAEFESHAGIHPNQVRYVDPAPKKESSMKETWDAANPRLSETWVEEAQRIVGGQRQEDYGDPEDNTERIALAWSAYLGVNITKRDFCWMMVLLKAMRDTHKAKRDNPVDAHGYLILMEQAERGSK
jgi:hypothetical protein